MTVDFDQYICRENTDSLKWDCNDRVFGRKDILPMWVADMDFPSPPQVVEAIGKRAGHGIFGYTEASSRYNAALIQWEKRRKGWSTKEEWLVHSPGVVTSINAAILAFTQEQDRILIQTPVYHPFFSGITENNRQLVTNPLVLQNGRYEMDFEDLERKLATGVKMMILCSPHNPVGRVWEKEELEEMGRLCVRHGVLLVSDEIHSDIVYPGSRHTPAASVSDQLLQNSVTCLSPTKTFNLAGLSTSVAVIPNRGLKTAFRKTLKRTGAGMLNIFGLTAAEAAFTYGEEWLEALLVYLQGNLKVLNAFVEKNLDPIKLIQPQATYLGWLDCRDLLPKKGSLREFFVREAGVGMNDGAMFGSDGAGFQRINFACPRSTLEDGLRRIKQAVDNRNT